MTPDAHTNQELFVEVGHGHELYVHDWGKQDAKTTIIYLHGGPGGGCSDGHKQLFDPQRQRVIFFDQRGSGRSLPLGALQHNTTDDLVSDISKIADKLGLETYILTGNSWGSTLALAYAIAEPKRVKALVISGIFTGTQKETDWINQGMFRAFYPEAWEAFVAAVPKKHHLNPATYHYDKALHGTPEEQKRSAYAYESMEAHAIQLDDRFRPQDYATYDPSSARMEMHYLGNNCFMPDHYIFDNAHKITMPTYLIQGRYDMVCPPTTAYELHKLLPNSELIWCISGHKREHENWNIARILLLELTK